ncbi:MAG: hypothetical protein H6Q82_1731 [Deltaproteobacteria bacterium]|nr:hypothetical protein [Deltaproteobacteria bacterium]
MQESIKKGKRPEPAGFLANPPGCTDVPIMYNLQTGERDRDSAVREMHVEAR